MKDLKLKILLTGIKLKIERGEILDDILLSYTNLTQVEKDEIISQIEVL